MTGFEPGFSGMGSDRSANCATTTAILAFTLLKEMEYIETCWSLVSLFHDFLYYDFLKAHILLLFW